MWCCCKAQYNPDICQFCTKLQIKDRKIDNIINKKLTIDCRKYFPAPIFHTVTYNSEIQLFVHVRFGPDRQRPYSKHNYCVLYYEMISPFIILKFYLDIIGRIILNQCDKYLLPALFENENKHQCREFKLIKGLVATSSQAIDHLTIRYCFDTYTLGKHYFNPYLSIDRPDKKKRRKMNSFCVSLTDALHSKFSIDVNVFVSKKKKLFICHYKSH